MTGASATVALIASIAIAGAFSVSGSRALTLADAPRFEAPTTCSDVTKINVACVGDSITAGAHSRGGNTTYPGQLQIMLDTKYPDKYCVQNLGVSGTTMQKAPFGDSPWWATSAFTAWTTNAKLWDIVIIMLGTNDAKDACPAENCSPSDGCQNASFCQNTVLGSCCNWPHAGQTNWTEDCSDLQCPYAEAYADMIQMAMKMGRTTAGPNLWLAVPPPLINGGSPGSPAKPYGMNQTVINDILPVVIPKIASANKVTNTVIDVFGAMGGTSGLECGYGANNGTANYLCSHKCRATDRDPSCSLQCDQQSCDPCHPNCQGYTFLAATVLKALGL